MPNFRDIPRFPKSAWVVNQRWVSLKETLSDYKKDQEEVGYKFELNPEYQRGHVWTKQQQINYVEYILQNGSMGRDIYFNHPGWLDSENGNMVCLDGLQRITAVIAFLDNRFRVFEGNFYKDYGDKLHNIDHTFNLHICVLKTDVEILTFYINFNNGGTTHTPKDIAKAERLRDEAIEKERYENKPTYKFA